jgi:hypothetical protein
MKSLSILGSLLIFSIFNSCIEMSDELEGLNYKPTLVIEGLVLDVKGNSFVRLNLSAPSGDSLNSYPVNDASVEIIENDSSAFHFNLNAPGLYTNDEFCGKIDGGYTLKVKYKDMEYLANSTIMPIVNIDSLAYKSVNCFKDDSCEYKIYVYAKRASQINTSYYKIKLYNNDSLYNAYSDMLLIDDQVFDSFENLEIPYTFNSHDTVKIEVYSLTKEAYNYFTVLSDLTNGNINSIFFYPQNPVSNISNGALGIFQASSISSKEIILP